MSFTVGDLYPGITDLLMGRITQDSKKAEAIRKGVLELTENYKFPGLQKSCPVVSLVAFQAVYDPDYFLPPELLGLEINEFDSFFIFNNPYVTPLTATTTNSGYNLRFKTIKDIEVLINIPGLPIFWTRHENQIWIGNVPDNNYSLYARIMFEHPFPNAGTPSAGDDPILLPNSWQDICEYMGAMRLAQSYNLSTKVTELHTRLYGDTKFQQTNGLEGSPGLIFQRTSQEFRDQTTSTKQLRLRMGGI